MRWLLGAVLYSVSYLRMCYSLFMSGSLYKLQVYVGDKAGIYSVFNFLWTVWDHVNKLINFVVNSVGTSHQRIYTSK